MEPPGTKHYVSRRRTRARNLSAMRRLRAMMVSAGFTRGKPARLQKMVKWVCWVEFLESHTTVGKGFGGKNEDDEYFDLLADT